MKEHSIELSDGWLNVKQLESGALEMVIQAQSVVFSFTFILPQERIAELIAALQAAKGAGDE